MTEVHDGLREVALVNGVPVAQGLPGGAPANPPHIYHSNISKHFKVTGEQESLCYEVFQERSNKYKVGNLVSSNDIPEMLDEVHVACESAVLKNLLQKINKGTDSWVDFDEFMLTYVYTPSYQSDHLEDMMAQKSQETCNGFLSEIRDKQKNHVSASVELLMYCVEDDLKQMRSCMHLPVAIGMLVAFMLACSHHERTAEIHAMEQAVERNLWETAQFATSGTRPFEHRRMGFKDQSAMSTPADFWSWMNGGFAPAFFKDKQVKMNEVWQNVDGRCKNASDALNHTSLNMSDLGSVFYNPGPRHASRQSCPLADTAPATRDELYDQRYLNHWIVVGGVRMRQQRLGLSNCSKQDKKLTAAMGKVGATCVPVNYSHIIWVEPGRRDLYNDFDGLYDQPGGETVYMKSNSQLKDVQQTLRELENRAWFDPQTFSIELTVPLFNPSQDALMLVAVMLYQNQAGHYHKMVEPAAVWTRPYRDNMSYILDALWFACVLRIMIGEVMKISNLMQQYGTEGFVKLAKSMWKHYFSLNLTVDYINVLTAFAIVGQWIQHLSNVDSVNSYLNAADPRVTGSWPEHIQLVKFFEVANIMKEYRETAKVTLALYPFFVVARVFRAFSGQPRLAVVTATVSWASVSLIHFIVVILSMFVCFVMAAYILFGREMDEYATLGRSAHSTFLVLMGHYDHQAMVEVSRSLACTWHVLFTVAIEFVMLNMLLSMVLDAHTEVKSMLGGIGQPIWGQAREIYNRWYMLQKGERVALETCYNFIEKYSEVLKQPEKALNEQVLCQVVPNLPPTQARRIIQRSNDKADAKARVQISLSQAMKCISKICSALESIKRMSLLLNDMLDYQRQLTKETLGALLGDDPDNIGKSKQAPPSPARERMNSNGSGTAADLKEKSPPTIDGVPTELVQCWERHNKAVYGRLQMIEEKAMSHFQLLEDHLLQLMPAITQLHQQTFQTQDTLPPSNWAQSSSQTPWSCCGREVRQEVRKM